VFLNRQITALMLIASLVASDAMTFWHLGSCGNACSGTEISSLSADFTCTHAGNPFAKRHGIQTNGIALSEHVDHAKPAPPCNSQDDSDDCSMCRWLVTARDTVQVGVATVSIELAPFPLDTDSEWVEPISKPRYQDASRRGPPSCAFAA